MDDNENRLTNNDVRNCQYRTFMIAWISAVEVVAYEQIKEIAKNGD